MFCSLFENFSTVTENRSIVAILESIRDGSLCGDSILLMRKLLESGNSDEFNNLKRKLPAFTPSGMFSKKRSKETLSFYSGIVHLDLDHIADSEFEHIFDLACKSEYTFALFKSPSGSGLKLFVRVGVNSGLHEHAYKAVSNFFEKLLDHRPDPACKDVSRLCFASYDPNLYLNQNSIVFDTPSTELNTQLVAPMNNIVKPFEHTHETDFESIVAFTEKKCSYQPGNRNLFIYTLACNCNRNGMAQEQTLKLIGENYDLPVNEVESSVKSAYLHNGDEFAKFAKSANLQKEQSDFDFLVSTPLIPQAVYDSLPELLKTGCNPFADLRERDVFLTGALAVLSGCLPKVKGVYDQKNVYPNLFSFIVAPAASGKGSMSFAKQLADYYHQILLKRSEDNMQAYNNEMEEYLLRQRQKNNIAGPSPEAPPFQVLFIPANASQAKILQHLKDNNGSSIICETEADSMSNALKQDWGNYSDMLRKAFHHECISSSKKSNNEYIEVRQPKLSVALSGTPNQVANLISSAEDGLFSRFIFYVFRSNQGWKDVSPAGKTINLTEHFSELSKRLYDMVLFLDNNPTEVLLTNDQWRTLNANFGAMLSITTQLSGEDSASIVKRLGLIFYRIIMIFTAIRKFEKCDTSNEIYCIETDFLNAMMLSETFLEHSMLLFSNLPKQSESKSFRKGSNKNLFLNALPSEFRRLEAVELGSKHNLSPRTVDELLKTSCAGGLLSQPKTGYYKKAPP